MATGPPPTLDFQGVLVGFSDDEEPLENAFMYHSFMCLFGIVIAEPAQLDFGRILFGKASESTLRPAFGRPECQLRSIPEYNPAETGPEAHFRPGSTIA